MTLVLKLAYAGFCYSTWPARYSWSIGDSPTPMEVVREMENVEQVADVRYTVDEAIRILEKANSFAWYPGETVRNVAR